MRAYYICYACILFIQTIRGHMIYNVMLAYHLDQQLHQPTEVDRWEISNIYRGTLENLKKSDLNDQNQTPPLCFKTVFVWGYCCVYHIITLNLHISHGKISYLYVSIVTPLSGEASCFG